MTELVEESLQMVKLANVVPDSNDSMAKDMEKIMRMRLESFNDLGYKIVDDFAMQLMDEEYKPRLESY